MQTEEAAAGRSRWGWGGKALNPTLHGWAGLGWPGAATPPSRRLVGVNQKGRVGKEVCGRAGRGKSSQSLARTDYRRRDTRPSSVAETQEQRAAPVRPERARPAALEKEGPPRRASVLLSPAGRDAGGCGLGGHEPGLSQMLDLLVEKRVGTTLVRNRILLLLGFENFLSLFLPLFFSLFFFNLSFLSL